MSSPDPGVRPEGDQLPSPAADTRGSGVQSEGNDRSSGGRPRWWLREFVHSVGGRAGRLWRWFASQVDTIPPDPPLDAERPVRARWRASWPVPFRILIDHLHPVPWDPPESFPQPVEVLWQQLRTSNDVLADELLSDAQRLFDEAGASAESAERRATTLQGTVAIAATVALTGGALVFDPNKIHGAGWRTAFAVGLALLVMTLVMTAWRALGASSRLHTFRTVSDENILARAQLPTAAMAKTRHTAYLLHAYGRNAEVVQVKIWYLKKAAKWFRCALLVFVILVVMACVYVVHTNPSNVARARPTHHSVQATTP